MERFLARYCVPSFARATPTGTSCATHRMIGSFSSRATSPVDARSACRSSRRPALSRHPTTPSARFDGLKCNPAIRWNANEVRWFGPPRGGENRRLYKTSRPPLAARPNPMSLSVQGDSDWMSASSCDFGRRIRVQSGALKCTRPFGLGVDEPSGVFPPKVAPVRCPRAA